MITVEDAEEKIFREVHLLPKEDIPFEKATGRILRESITADRNLPPFDRVMMDGVVLSSEGWNAGHRNFRVTGLQLPGSPPLSLADPLGCIKAMTGAPMPQGCDIVVPREEIEENQGTINVKESFEVQPGRYLHQAGVDCVAGDELVPPGVQIGPSEIAVATSCGYETLSVTQKIRVMVIDTGDELIEVGMPIKPHQIRRSNAHALTSSCNRMPFVTSTSRHCSDNESAMNSILAEALKDNDLILLSGGVSKGDRDHVPDVLKDHGVEKHFHWVRQWPGKPLWFGKQPQGPLVFGLPGNPLSATTCFHRYVVNVLRAMAGAKPLPAQRVLLSEPTSHSAPTTAFVPVKLCSTGGGILRATPQRPRNSGDFVSVVGTDGFVQLPPDQEDFPMGFEAVFFPW
jgi:molybdopterin molybdotransferase